MDVVSYKCPKCSASLLYDIDKQDWYCDYCKSEFTRDELEKIENEKSHKVFDEVSTEGKYEEGAIAYMCPSCGAKIVTDKNTAATFCIYCHNATVIASRLEDEHRPASIIPFKLKKEKAIDAIKSLCKSRPLLPKDFTDYAKRGEISGLYVPFWLFDVDVDATLNARADRITTWSDSRYYYTKTDTYNVERGGSATFSKVPCDGSVRMDDKLMESLEPFDYTSLMDFSLEYLSGHYAESYDVDANIAYKNVSARVNSSADSMLRSTVAGYSYVNVTNENIRATKVVSKNVMLPVWTLMAVYKGKNYIFAMNGQTGKITGKLPVSKTKLVLWFCSIFVIVFLLCFVGVMLV
ncbi:MAG: hypothetical protein FWC47_06150 [Oscillospiraceae bacterium]|nr:hypothetical protein [Oscillospiraceae bacterium]